MSKESPIEYSGFSELFWYKSGFFAIFAIFYAILAKTERDMSNSGMPGV